MIQLLIPIKWVAKLNAIELRKMNGRKSLNSLCNNDFILEEFERKITPYTPIYETCCLNSELMIQQSACLMPYRF